MAQASLTGRRLLVVGATGMLGQALMAAARADGADALGLARTGTDIACDIADAEALRRALEKTAPDMVVNAAAVTNLEQCEREPAGAWLTNARAAGVLDACCREIGARLIHVSTDHYFTGDGDGLHDETAPVRLLNEYARSKYAAEAMVLCDPDALVVRTNVTGWRGWAGRPTFFEWLVHAIEARTAITLFSDFYTSTIDSTACARHLLRLAAMGATGLINLAARDVASKERFARETARALGVALDGVTLGSVRSLRPVRAESLGLDVSRAERLLGESLPDTRQVVAALVAARP